MRAALSTEVDRFREAIARMFGLAFDEGAGGALATLLEKRASALGDSIPAYLERIERLARPESILSEARALAPELTVGETYFFRHAEQLEAFARGVLPKLLATGARIRVLSAACASGEEAFSLAMLLEERGCPPGAVEIRAVDLNPDALARAARATYSNWSLRGTPPEMRTRWFHTAGNDLRLDEAIRRMVRFEQRNLAVDDPELFAPGTYDVIFCRNAMMYFAPDQARRLVARLERALVPGGYLFLGHAETLRGLSQAFHLRQSHGAFYYQRRGMGAPAVAVTETDVSLERATPSPALDASWVEEIQRASDRVADLASRPRSPDPRPPAAAGDAPAIRTAMELFERERFTEALDSLRGAVGHARDPDVLLLRATLLAHSGALAEAEQTCRELLGVDELNAGAHYVLALCREAGADLAASAAHDRTAAYLDPSFAMPHFHLGRSARRQGDQVTARLELGRALELLKREESSRILLFGGGFSREALVSACVAELAASGAAA